MRYIEVALDPQTAKVADVLVKRMNDTEDSSPTWRGLATPPEKADWYMAMPRIVGTTLSVGASKEMTEFLVDVLREEITDSHPAIASAAQELAQQLAVA